ncbi:hypothetical protein PENANT_c012G00212 [Penicillium antarcticum]|uniref:Uncharacterized protein n=1 Tax=Penicillium antarcticum TaxID=416450 RepID=A0A1V6Q629_9EURO|nr:hypothetical protein PENANT_c012G00212 [Penicillium antarcticum]
MARKSMFIQVNNGQDGEYYLEPIDNMWWVAVSTPGRMDNPRIRLRSDRELLEYVMECIADGDCFIADEPLHHTTGGWLCMPVPIREGQERKQIYQDAEDLAEYFANEIGSRKMRVDRKALWHSHPEFDMEDSLIVPTQVILPGEDASRVRKYPVCFGDVPPPPRSVDITSLSSRLQTMEPHNANSKNIADASIRFEDILGRLEEPHLNDQETEEYLAEIGLQFSKLSNLLLEDGYVTSREMQDTFPMTDEALENITDSFNNLQVFAGPAKIHAPIARRFDHAERMPQCSERWEAMTQAVYDGDLDDNDVNMLLKEREIEYAELDPLIESDRQDRAAKMKDEEMEF